jgi:hypothetical protein
MIWSTDILTSMKENMKEQATYFINFM